MFWPWPGDEVFLPTSDRLQTEPFEWSHAGFASEYTFVAAALGFFAREEKSAFLAINVSALDQGASPRRKPSTRDSSAASAVRAVRASRASNSPSGIGRGSRLAVLVITSTETATRAHG
jgi:hypothetical protein